MHISTFIVFLWANQFGTFMNSQTIRTARCEVVIFWLLIFKFFGTDACFKPIAPTLTSTINLLIAFICCTETGRVLLEL